MSLRELDELVSRVLQSSQRPSPLASDFAVDEVEVRCFSLSRYSLASSTEPAQQKVVLRYSTPRPAVTIEDLAVFIRRLRSLACAPEVNRLNHVRQLATAYFSSTVAGGHSRLEHVLGAFDTAVALLRKADVDLLAMGEPNYKVHRRILLKTALVLAFFHDVFHAPFGHVLDPLRPILLPQAPTNRLDKAALAIAFADAARGQGLVYELLARHVEQGTEQQRAAELGKVLEQANLILAEMLNDRPELPLALRPIGFIFDILSSRVDHDRLDYIPRDAIHILHDGAQLPDFSSFASIREVNGEVRLVFDLGAEESLKRLLDLRRLMYSRVYEAREKAPYDEMIRHAVVFLLEQHGCLKHVTELADIDAVQSLAQRFVRLSDSGLVRVINEAGDGPVPEIVRALIQDVFANRPFQCVEQREIENPDVAVLQYRYEALAKRFHDGAGQILRPMATGLRPELSQFQEAYAKVFAFFDQPVEMQIAPGADMPPLPADGLTNSRQGSDGSRQDIVQLPASPLQDSLYWILRLFGRDAAYRLTLERRLWHDLAETWQGFDAWTSKVAEDFVARRPDAASLARNGNLLAEARREQMAALRETPLVFVAMSRPGTAGILGQLLMESSSERDCLLVSGAGRNVEKLAIVPMDEINNFWLALYRPACMPASVDGPLAEILKRMIEQKTWIYTYCEAAAHFLRR